MRKFSKCEAECTKHRVHLSDGTPISGGWPLDTEGQPIKACIQDVPDGGRFVTSHSCGRKLKGDARYPHLCGIHISAIDRAKAKSAARSEARTSAELRMDATRATVESLNARLGISASMETTSKTTGPNAFISRPTGFARVRIGDLETLADEIESLKAIIAERDRYS